ncbi:MAG: TonB-dependent receptor [Chitinophagaceae bacterium]
MNRNSKPLNQTRRHANIILRYICIYIAVLLAGTAYAQTASIKGKVVGVRNEPIEFATVNVEETDFVTSTDEDGRFAIDVRKISLQTLRITVSYVGKQSATVSVRLKQAQPILIRLLDNSLQLDSVQVQAYRQTSRSNSSIIFNSESIEQLQAFSLADVINQLPGKATTAPNLQQVQTTTLRTSSQGLNAINNSFGVAIYVDGVRISNDANMQNRNLSMYGISNSAVPSSVSGNTGTFDVPMNGLDLRDIALDNIEQVEVAQGIVSAKYGELTNGAIFLEQKKGKTPYNFKLNINGGSSQFGLSKGLNLGKKAGALNLSATYLHSNNDPRDKVKSYSRVNTSAIWTTYLATKIRNSLQFSYNRRLDNIKEDPDDDSRRMMYTKSYGFSLSNRTNITLTGILKNINLNVQYSRSKQDSRNQWLLNHGPQPYADKDTTGIYEGYIMQGSYLAEERVIGEPVSLSTTIDANLANFSTGSISHLVSFGGSVSSSGNHGAGIVLDPKKPRWLAVSNKMARPYSYNYLPDLVNYSYYIEDNMVGKLFGKNYTASVGLRSDIQNKWSSFNPRISFRYKLDEHWSVNIAYGMSTKAPSMAHRFPAPTWMDIPLLTLVNTSKLDSSLYLVYTKKIVADNSNLKASRSQQVEIGAQYKGEWFNASLYAYAKHNKNGFNSSKTYSPITLPVYGYTLLSDPLRKATYYATGDSVTYNTLSRYVVTNGLYTADYGVEWMLQTREYKPLRTSFSMSTAFSYSDYDNRGDNITQSVDESYIEAGRTAWYGVYTATKSHNWGVLTKLSTTTHIPSLGFVVTVQSDIHWQEKSVTDAASTIPIGYLDKNLLYHPIENFDDSNPDYGYLRLTPTNQLETKLPFVYANVNVQVAKEIKKNIRLAVNAYNIFNIRPHYTNTVTKSMAIYNDPVSLTAGLILKF